MTREEFPDIVYHHNVSQETILVELIPLLEKGRGMWDNLVFFSSFLSVGHEQVQAIQMLRSFLHNAAIPSVSRSTLAFVAIG